MARGFRSDNASNISNAISQYYSRKDSIEQREYNREQDRIDREERNTQREFSNDMAMQSNDRANATAQRQDEEYERKNKERNNLKKAREDVVTATLNPLNEQQNSELNSINSKLGNQKNLGASSDDIGGEVKPDGKMVIKMNDGSEKPMTYDGSDDGEQVIVDTNNLTQTNAVASMVAQSAIKSGANQQQVGTAVRSAFVKGDDGFAKPATSENMMGNMKQMSKLESDAAAIPDTPAPESADGFFGNIAADLRRLSDIKVNVEEVGYGATKANRISFSFGGVKADVVENESGAPVAEAKIQPSKFDPVKDAEGLDKAREINTQTGPDPVKVEQAQAKVPQARGNKQMAAALGELYALGDPSVTIEMVRNASTTGNPYKSSEQLAKMGLEEKKLQSQINKYDREAEAAVVKANSTNAESQVKAREKAFDTARKVRKESITLAVESAGTYDSRDNKAKTKQIADASIAFDRIFEQTGMNPMEMKTWGGYAAVTAATKIFLRNKSGSQSMAGSFAAAINGYGPDDAGEFTENFTQLASVVGGEATALNMMKDPEVMAMDHQGRTDLMNQMISMSAARQEAPQ